MPERPEPIKNVHVFAFSVNEQGLDDLVVRYRYVIRKLYQIYHDIQALSRS